MKSRFPATPTARTRPACLFACVFLRAALFLEPSHAAPPAISDTPDQTIAANGATGFLPFTIGDAETAASNLSLSAASSNTVLAPTNRIVFSGSASNRFVRVTPISNQMGQALITIAVTDAASESASDSFLLTVTNGQPTISDVANRLINAGITSAPISFVVFDKETSPSNLVVRGVSSDTSLVANQNIFFGGSGSNRTVRFLPALQLGSTTISLTVTDVFGATASDTFELTLSNSRPTISYLGSVTAVMNSTGAMTAVTVGDLESPASNLTVTASSSNPTVVPDGNISLSGSGSNRFVTIVPATNQVGSTLVSLIVKDDFAATATNGLSVSVSQFGELTNSLPGYSYAALAPGDFDGDGLLDFAVMGYGPAATVIYRNLGNGSFTNIGANLAGLYYGDLAWVDNDRDGDLDLAVSGQTEAGTYVALVYSNGGNGQFNPSQANLPALRYSTLAWGDYDNDGDPDLLICGLSNSVPITRLLRNDQGWLADSGIEFSPVSSAMAAWGDYDNDGDLDLLLTGLNSGNTAQARIYRNAGNGTFVNIVAPMAGLAAGVATWSDYDGDGDLDALLFGSDTSGYGYTAVYRNDGGDQFAKANIGLDQHLRVGAAWADYDNDGDPDLAQGYSFEFFGPHFYRNEGGVFLDSSNNILGLGQGRLAWGDFDNDGRLDLLQTGENYSATARFTRLFRNYGPVTNTLPTPPAGLVAVVAGRTVQLSWASGADANQTNRLTHNLRVGTTSGKGNIVSPQSLSDGRRLLPADGNVGLNSCWSLRDLAPGTYYASVQAVDAGWAGSPFSPEITFTIASPPGPPSASTEAATGLTFSDAILNGTANPNGLVCAAWFEFGTTTNYGLQTAAQAIGSGTNDVNLGATVTGLLASTTYHVRTVTANSAGTNRGAERVFTTPAFGPFSPLLGVVPDPGASGGQWIDFDNDGDLDLVSSRNAIRNDGGVFTNTGVELSNGSGTWSDYDRDNFADCLRPKTVERNNQNGTFTTITLNLAPMPDYNGVAAWGDFDADGDLDLLVTGSSVNQAYYTTLLFRNDGDGQFTSLSNQLPVVVDSGLSAPAWLDYDSDGWLDMLLSSFHFASQPVFLYRNFAGQAFTNSGAVLTGTSGTCRDWADFDNDGDLDLVIGDTSSYPSSGTRVFRNDGGGGFIDIGATNLPGSSQVFWGDFDNDDDPDLLLIAPDPIYFRSAQLFWNDAGVFSDSGFKILGATYISTGDYDRDGDLDILASGTLDGSLMFARVFRNNCVVSNAPPTAPTNLQAAVARKAVQLNWNPPTDGNQTNGWSYNVRVGSVPGRTDVMSPLANLTNGYRRVPRFGNAGVGLGWALANLPVGVYYWSVQAVDHSFAGSLFATEASFVVPPCSPDILSTSATKPTLVSVALEGTVNPNGAVTTIWFQYGETTNYTDSSVVRLLPALNSATTTNVLVPGLLPFTTYHYRLVVTNDLGTTFSADQTFKTVLFTEISASFNGLSARDSAWGDFNQDGQPDVLIRGSGLYSVFLNTNGSFTEITNALPSGSQVQALADVNRDGKLDVFAAGLFSPLLTNNGAASFATNATAIPFVLWTAMPCDVDNDGDVDALLTGNNIVKMYTNNGDGKLADSFITFPGVRSVASSSWEDYDRDGDLDLMLVGVSSNSVPITRLYRNDGSNNFTLVPGWPVYSSASMGWADYDNDGDPDLLMAGGLTNGTRVTRIYRNDGSNAFTELDVGLPGVTGVGARWGDFDNDGRPDVLLAGYTNGSLTRTMVFRNAGGSFTPLELELPAIQSGVVSCADADQDGDLEILITGLYQPARLFRNNAVLTNTIPQPPTNLAAAVNGNSVSFSWLPGFDANQTGGHTFNVRVGTAPGLDDVVSAEATADGTRLAPARGNARQATHWPLNKLAARTYYWSVQAIDHSFAASAFASEQSFVITNRAPIASSQVVVMGEDTSRAIVLSAIDLDGQPVTYSISALPTNGVLSGTAPNVSYRPGVNFFGADHFLFQAGDGLTNSLAATVSLIVTQITDVSVWRLSIAPTSGKPRLTLTAEPYERYSILASEDLIHWITLTNLASTNGLMALIDTDASFFPRRFYRAAIVFPPVTISLPQKTAAGTFQVSLVGELARRYVIEASTNFTTWTQLTNMLFTAKPMVFTDPAAGNFPKRFYRIRPIR